MDGTPTPDDVSNVIKLLSGGGNAAMIVLAFIAWQVWKAVRDTLATIRDAILGMRAEAAKAHAETLHGQKQIKRALATLGSGARAALDPDDI